MAYKILKILVLLAFCMAIAQPESLQAAPVSAVPATNESPASEPEGMDSDMDEAAPSEAKPTPVAPAADAPAAQEAPVDPVSTVAAPAHPAAAVSPAAVSGAISSNPTKKASLQEDDPALGNYLSGRFAEQQGDTDNGIRFLRESLKRDPDNKEMLASLYRMLVISGQIEDAIAVAHKIEGRPVVDEGSEFSPEMLLTVEDGKAGRFDSALKRLQSIHKSGFNNLLVPLMEEWLKLGTDQLKAPVEAKQIMPDAHVILPHVYLNAAFINDIAGFNDAALAQYQAAVKDERIEPFRAVEALVNYYDRKDMPKERQELVKSYIEAHGDSFLADELLATSKAEHPKPLVANAGEGLAEVFYTMANIFHGVRAPADEIATLHVALYLRPNFPAAQFLLADAEESAQDFHAAITAYEAIDPRSPYFARGKIRSIYDESEVEDPAVVLTKLDQLAAQNPHSVDALLAKGDILRAQKKLREAIEAYTQAAARLPKLQKPDWVVFYSRGDCYEQLGQWAKAEADMKKALELSPGEPDVLNYLGYSWLSQHQNMAQARKMIEDAYDARPEDPHIIDSMGYALYINGDFASAKEYFEQALERTPNDPTVNDHLGDAYWQLGMKTEARYQWQRSLDDDPDDETARNLHTKLDKGLALIHPAAQAAVTSDDKKPAAAATATTPSEE